MIAEGLEAYEGASMDRWQGRRERLIAHRRTAAGTPHGTTSRASGWPERCDVPCQGLWTYHTHHRNDITKSHFAHTQKRNISGRNFIPF